MVCVAPSQDSPNTPCQQPWVSGGSTMTAWGRPSGSIPGPVDASYTPLIHGRKHVFTYVLCWHHCLVEGFHFSLDAWALGITIGKG